MGTYSNSVHCQKEKITIQKLRNLSKKLIGITILITIQNYNYFLYIEQK